MKSYELSFTMSSGTTSMSNDHIFYRGLCFFTLVGLQLLSKLRSCCVSLSLLSDALGTAVVSGTLWVWGRLGSGSSFTGSLVAEKSTLPTLPQGKTFEWAGYRLGSFNVATDEELVSTSRQTSEAAFLLLSLPLSDSDWGLHSIALPNITSSGVRSALFEATWTTSSSWPALQPGRSLSGEDLLLV